MRNSPVDRNVFRFLKNTLQAEYNDSSTSNGKKMKDFAKETELKKLLFVL